MAECGTLIRVRVSVRGAWTAGDARRYRLLSASHVELNHAKGFDDESGLDFLADLRGLRRLTIIVPGPVDLSPVERCRELESLDLSAHSFRKPIRLAGLDRLRDLVVESPDAVTDLYELTGLTDLLIGRYAQTSLRPLARLGSLRSLRLYEARELRTLDGIEELPALEKLELAGVRKLTDITALPAARALTKLDITNAVAVRDWSLVGELANLRWLGFEEVKTMESLDFVHRLKALRKLYVVGAKVADDSVTRLRQHPSLRRISLPPAP